MNASVPLFFRQFQRDFFHMGAVMPSSRYLGQAGVAYLARKQGPVRVLEAGAGTGSFTREIIPLLEPGDSLDAVELNTGLVSYLRHRLHTDVDFLPRPGVTINLINADVRSVASGQYDFIVFSLPLTNFPPPLVQEILSLMMARLKPGGVFSYVKYIFIGRFKYLFGGPQVRAHMDANQAIIQSFAGRYQIDRRAVLRNVPPTWVYYWQKQ
ncbi:MAG: methyltransferase domain-containing protein [Chloroflexi bacterium]|nr:MAG: methyltransferase domain-containing protein [Chloroflexota bacterium]